MKKSVIITLCFVALAVMMGCKKESIPAQTPVEFVNGALIKGVNACWQADSNIICCLEARSYNDRNSRIGKIETECFPIIDNSAPDIEKAIRFGELLLIDPGYFHDRVRNIEDVKNILGPLIICDGRDHNRIFIRSGWHKKFRITVVSIENREIQVQNYSWKKFEVVYPQFAFRQEWQSADYNAAIFYESSDYN
jgi:hypothetical protein